MTGIRSFFYENDTILLFTRLLCLTCCFSLLTGYDTHVNVITVWAFDTDQRNSKGERVCLSESLPGH